MALCGPNEILRTRKRSPWRLLISQFSSPLMLILFAAAFISIAVGLFPGQKPNIADAVLIVVIALFSGLAGFLQEFKAEKTIEVLQGMATPKAIVIRDGVRKEIVVTEVVPGDLVVVEGGDVIPADARVIHTVDLMVDESLLTGESESVKKGNHADIFMHTYVFSGNATAVVQATGMKTRVGAIAEKLQQLQGRATTFEVELKELSSRIFWVTLAVAAVMTVIGFAKFGIYNAVLVAVSLAVAAIPEALPAVMTISLAIGGRAMAARHALIRRLSAVESIGAVDIICTDKTGTLTRNEMTVTSIFSSEKVWDPSLIREEDLKALRPLLECALLCNNAKMVLDSKGVEKAVGSQTEIAIKTLARRLIKADLETRFRRVHEIPFTPDRKMMAVVCKHPGAGFLVFAKGAPEMLLSHCKKIFLNGSVKSLTKIDKAKILLQNNRFASNRLRVLGFAYKEADDVSKSVEEGLVWLGLQAMVDPPRDGVSQALHDCESAGIRVVMLTGDNPLTAQAIARGIGLKTSGVLEGSDIEKMTDEALDKRLCAGVNIFARVSPFHKLRVLELLQKKYRVAMTGDGVNDALALKKADVGIAMGVRGTDVAKEASDIILLDDNFATIRNAVEEGRKTFENIRKFLNYLLSCNFAEIAVLFGATLFLDLKAPILLPVHLLWINLLTDGLPAIALGVDPSCPGIMQAPPRKKGSSLIDKHLAGQIVGMGILMTGLLFATFFLVLPSGFGIAQSTLFTGFVIFEFVRIRTIRSQEGLSWLSNKWLVASLAGSLALQLLVVYSPLNVVFHVQPLGWYEWLVLAGGAIAGYLGGVMISRVIRSAVKE